MIRCLIILFTIPLLISCNRDQIQQVSVKTGAEVMIETRLADLQGRSVGLVMNPTARIHGTHVLDSLLALGVNIQALFAPEHGFRGNFGAGEKISDGIDEASGLQVFSLYGDTRKPTSAMLNGIDLLIFDMQDVGARFYTYISTMGLVMEAAADNGIEIWVLDRPNPASGVYISGWMREDAYKSFVGAFPMPIAHGMTTGEIAKMAIGENWLETDAVPNLQVIPMDGWRRDMLWPETGLPWVPPSPNLPTFESSWVYLGTCLFEGSNLSEGRGTDDSFLLFGAPNMDFPDEIRAQMGEKFGLDLAHQNFTPVEMPGRALRPKHENTLCRGLKISVPKYDVNRNDPVAFGHMLLKAALQNTPDSRTTNGLLRLAGTTRILDYLNAPGLEDPSSLWADEIEAFRKKREPYLLYK